jgi:hypothetical protein
MTPPRPHRRYLLPATIALAALFVAAGLRLPVRFAPETVVYESICRQLLANSTEGRQALIGSAWWAPLPILIRLPLASVLPAGGPPLASLIVSALAGALGVLLMAVLGRDWRLGRARGLLVAGLLLNPWFLGHAVDGSSATTTLVFVLLTAHTLTRWLAGNSLRYLVTFGFSAGFLLLTDLTLAPWLGVGAGMLFWRRRGYGEDPGERRATVLLALLPLAYMLGLWVLMNWLIMGDGLYFVRSLFRASAYTLHRAPTGLIDAADLACAVFALLALLAAVLRSDRPGAGLAALAAAPLLLALGFERIGLLWARAPLLFVLHPLALVAFGAAWGGARVRRRRMPLAAWLLGVALAAAPAAQYLLAPPAQAIARDDDNAVRDAVEALVTAQSPYALVFVCGYESYRLLGYDGGPCFRFALDFNFNKVREDYHGHDLYLLVHAPQGRAAMDSIHWQHADIFALGSRSTLYAGDWDGWRLYEIIQAPIQRSPIPAPRE